MIGLKNVGLKNSAQKETVVALQNGGKRLRVPIMHTRDRKRNEKCTMMDKKMKSSQWKNSLEISVFLGAPTRCLHRKEVLILCFDNIFRA